MNPDPSLSIGEAEREVGRFMCDQLQAHLVLSEATYNLSSSFIEQWLESRDAPAGPSGAAVLLHLSAISDDLRCVNLLAMAGYPWHASSLAVAVIERAARAICFAGDDEQAEKWLANDDPKDADPGWNARSRIERACQILDPEANANLANGLMQRHTELCMSKHGHAAVAQFQSVELGRGVTNFRNGPDAS